MKIIKVAKFFLKVFVLLPGSFVSRLKTRQTAQQKPILVQKILPGGLSEKVSRIRISSKKYGVPAIPFALLLKRESEGVLADNSLTFKETTK